MFGKNSTASIVVSRDKIQLSLDDTPPVSFPFPAQMVNNLELLDLIGFEKALRQFFEQKKCIHAACSLLMDETFLFWKKIPLDSVEGEFLSLIPLPLDQQTNKKIQVDTDNIIMVYNSAILNAIQRALHASKNTVTMISVGSLDGTEGTPIANLRSEILLFKSKKSPSLFLILSSVFFLLLIVGGVSYYFFFQKKTAVPTSTKIIKKVSSPTPSIAFLNPKNIRIDVLNGSGIVGEAGRLKLALEQEALIVSSVGTAPLDIDATRIAAKKTVPPSFIKDLKKVLENQYLVNTSFFLLPEASDSADIVVTIGTTSALLK